MDPRLQAQGQLALHITAVMIRRDISFLITTWCGKSVRDERRASLSARAQVTRQSWSSSRILLPLSGWCAGNHCCPSTSMCAPAVRLSIAVMAQARRKFPVADPGSDGFIFRTRGNKAVNRPTAGWQQGRSLL